MDKLEHFAESLNMVYNAISKPKKENETINKNLLIHIINTNENSENPFIKELAKEAWKALAKAEGKTQ